MVMLKLADNVAPGTESGPGVWDWLVWANQRAGGTPLVQLQESRVRSQIVTYLRNLLHIINYKQKYIKGKAALIHTF